MMHGFLLKLIVLVTSYYKHHTSHLRGTCDCVRGQNLPQFSRHDYTCLQYDTKLHTNLSGHVVQGQKFAKGFTAKHIVQGDQASRSPIFITTFRRLIAHINDRAAIVG